MNVYLVCRVAVADYFLTRWEKAHWIYVRANDPIEAGEMLSRPDMYIKWGDIREVTW